jgi:ankyrin repeat protein
MLSIFPTMLEICPFVRTVSILMLRLTRYSDWAVQNQKLEAVRFLLENFEVDVLAKNSYGRSALTDAFNTGNTDVIEACLSHSSSTEERLLSTDPDMGKTGEQEEEGSTQALAGAVTHKFSLGAPSVPVSSAAPKAEAEGEAGEVLAVRELPITRADNPFGNEAAPQDDTTGVCVLLTEHFSYTLMWCNVILPMTCQDWESGLRRC